MAGSVCLASCSKRSRSGPSGSSTGIGTGRKRSESTSQGTLHRQPVPLQQSHAVRAASSWGHRPGRRQFGQTLPFRFRLALSATFARPFVQGGNQLHHHHLRPRFQHRRRLADGQLYPRPAPTLGRPARTALPPSAPPGPSSCPWHRFCISDLPAGYAPLAGLCAIPGPSRASSLLAFQPGHQFLRALPRRCRSALGQLGRRSCRLQRL